MPRYREPVVPEKQLMLLPPSVDEFVEGDCLSRIISEIVDRLDTSSLGRSYSLQGAPAYRAVDLLKVLIFGMCIGMRSSRDLAAALRYDLRFMWLAGMEKPTYRTICRFRRTHEKRIGEILMQTVKIARELDMVLLKRVALDGTKIKAVGSKRGYQFPETGGESQQETSQAVAQVLAEAEAADQADSALLGDAPGDGVPNDMRTPQARRERLDEIEAQKTAQKPQRVVKSDPESRMMKTEAGPRPCFNGQVVVDDASQMIINADVTQDASDNYQFRPMLEGARAILGAMPQRVLADGGYWSKDTLDYADETGIDAYINPSCMPKTTVGPWHYDEATDTYSSPDGDLLTRQRERQSRGHTYILYRSRKTGREKWVNRSADQLDRMRDKVRSPEGQQIYASRKAIVEPVFAHFKGRYRLQRFLLRGLAGATFEFILACIAHNLGKIAALMQRQRAAAAA